MNTNQYSDEVVKILNRLYFNSRGDISGMMQTHNVKIATQAINKLITDARIDELERMKLWLDSDLNHPTMTNGVNERLAQLKSLTNSKGSKSRGRLSSYE